MKLFLEPEELFLYEIAGEMFIYLTMCPKFKFDWTQFYVNLLQNGSLEFIKENLSKIMETEQKNDRSMEDIANRIFIEIRNKFPNTTIDIVKKDSKHDVFIKGTTGSIFYYSILCIIHYLSLFVIMLSCPSFNPVIII